MQIVDLSEESLEKFYGLGWIPDTPDHRDLYLALPPLTTSLPTKVDLREHDLPVFNQGRLGSCTGNAVAGAYAHNLKKQGKTVFTPSRLFIYYNARKYINTTDRDSGAVIRDAVKSVNVKGVCTETNWIYDISKFKNKPLRSCYKEAKDHQSITYSRLHRSIDSFKQCISEGLPFVFGFTVYDSFYSKDVAKTGMMTWPTPTEKSHGGHAVMAVGYDDSLEGGRFIIRNSWGSEWGDKGYFYMPYDFIVNSNLTADFWVIETVE